MADRMWACMVREPESFSWVLYELDPDRRYISDVAEELRASGTEAGVMEVP